MACVWGNDGLGPYSFRSSRALGVFGSVRPFRCLSRLLAVRVVVRLVRRRDPLPCAFVRLWTEAQGERSRRRSGAAGAVWVGSGRWSSGRANGCQMSAQARGEGPREQCGPLKARTIANGGDAGGVTFGNGAFWSLTLIGSKKNAVFV